MVVGMVSSCHGRGVKAEVSLVVSSCDDGNDEPGDIGCHGDSRVTSGNSDSRHGGCGPRDPGNTGRDTSDHPQPFCPLAVSQKTCWVMMASDAF